MDLISIIIPLYNHAPALAKSLISISKQTYRPLEIIIVNDGSTDNFQQVIKQAQSTKKLADIDILLINQKNQGASQARNNGFKKATGKYVIFWDADTLAKYDMLFKMQQALQQNKQASYAYSSFKFGCKTIYGFEFNEQRLKKTNYIDTTSLIRKEDFLEFDPSLKKFQDWDLWLSMLQKNRRGIFVPEILFKKIISGRRGISSWLPRFLYRLPFKIKSVKDYERARDIVLQKHGLK